MSRTDLDFEQALRAEGTVVLKEGLDVNAMGIDTSPSPMSAAFGSPTSPRQFTPRPSTPTIVPSPSPIPGPSSARLPTSSHDVLDAQDTPERQANRRSMYRSPGTSSSPDLATLLRKAKERGGPVGPHLKKDRRRDSPPPPVPPPHDRPSSSGRPRSSTSYSSQAQAAKGKLNKPNKGEAWAPPSPRQTKENGSTKVVDFYIYFWVFVVVLIRLVYRQPNLRLERKLLLSWVKCWVRRHHQLFGQRLENDQYASSLVVETHRVFNS